MMTRKTAANILLIYNSEFDGSWPQAEPPDRSRIFKYNSALESCYLSVIVSKSVTNDSAQHGVFMSSASSSTLYLVFQASSDESKASSLSVAPALQQLDNGVLVMRVCTYVWVLAIL